MYHGERFNAWTHLVGAVLALVGAVWLLLLASASGDSWKQFSVAIYGVTLVLLYSTSTLYHSVQGPAKRLMQKLDHLSIYLLIAGSYTPFCLVSLRGPWGWSLFATVWCLALIGMLQEIKPRSEARVLSLVIYAVMGWIVLVAVQPLLAAMHQKQPPAKIAVALGVSAAGAGRLAAIRANATVDRKKWLFFMSVAPAAGRPGRRNLGRRPFC